MTAYLVPRDMRPSRVPDITKPEVDRQIQDLPDMELIRPSDSLMTSTIVCVSKIGDVQTACDRHCLNTYIADDVYPMLTINDVLQIIARTGTIATVILCLILDVYYIVSVYFIVF